MAGETSRKSWRSTRSTPKRHQPAFIRFAGGDVDDSVRRLVDGYGVDTRRVRRRKIALVAIPRIQPSTTEKTISSTSETRL